jgi:hypothetical protein
MTLVRDGASVYSSFARPALLIASILPRLHRLTALVICLNAHLNPSRPLPISLILGTEMTDESTA